MAAATELLSGIRAGQSVAVFIGPEGGFEEEEIEEADVYKRQQET